MSEPRPTLELGPNVRATVDVRVLPADRASGRFLFACAVSFDAHHEVIATGVAASEEPDAPYLAALGAILRVAIARRDGPRVRSLDMGGTVGPEIDAEVALFVDDLLSGSRVYFRQAFTLAFVAPPPPRILQTLLDGVSWHESVPRSVVRAAWWFLYALGRLRFDRGDFAGSRLAAQLDDVALCLRRLRPTATAADMREVLETVCPRPLQPPSPRRQSAADVLALWAAPITAPDDPKTVSLRG